MVGDRINKTILIAANTKSSVLLSNYYSITEFYNKNRRDKDCMKSSEDQLYINPYGVKKLQLPTTFQFMICLMTDLRLIIKDEINKTIINSSQH